MLYPTHEVYVSAVKDVTEKNVKAGYILQVDADATIAAAEGQLQLQHATALTSFHSILRSKRAVCGATPVSARSADASASSLSSLARSRANAVLT